MRQRYRLYRRKQGGRYYIHDDVTGKQDNLLAFVGSGPFYPETTNDAVNSDATYENSSSPGSGVATPPGSPGTQFTVGLYGDTNAVYEYISDGNGNQGRTYGIGVDILPVSP